MFFLAVLKSLLPGNPSTLRDGTWAKLNAHHLGTYYVHRESISAFVRSLQHTEGTDLERRQRAAVVHS